MDRADLLELLSGRLMAQRPGHPLRVAVDGVDAAGKTSLADELAEVLRAAGQPVLRASIDRFHQPRAVRYRRGPDSPEGYYLDSFDLPALRRDLLDPLGPGGSRLVRLERFDFRADAPLDSPAVTVDPRAVLLFDGVFLLRPELRGCWDDSLFLRVDFDTVLARAVLRDAAYMGGAEAVVTRYHQRYIPAQQRYLDECRPAQRAGLVIDNTNPAHPIAMLR